METFSALLAICVGTSPVPGEFPAQRPVTWSFHVFFDLRLNKWLRKQSWSWWFEMLPCPLWRHCYVLVIMLIQVHNQDHQHSAAVLYLSEGTCMASQLPVISCLSLMVRVTALGKGEVPGIWIYICVVKFQGHTGQKITNFDPNWTFPDCDLSLNSPMALKWYTKLNVV